MIASLIPVDARVGRDTAASIIFQLCLTDCIAATVPISFFGIKNSVKVKINVNGSRQECPLHTVGSGAISLAAHPPR